jgi:probable rRNA maturation factor
MFDKLNNEIKEDILGKRYELSIALVSKEKSRKINKQYRKKDKPTNVLSFSLTKNSGEIVLCPAVIRTEAKNLGQTYEGWLSFLVIHGMLHLKGYEHSSTMETLEEKYDKKHNSRYRHRISDDASRGSRIRKGRKKS